MNFFLNLLYKEKILHSLIEENNIIGKYDNYNLVTRDQNLVTIFSIDGVSYSAFTQEERYKFLDLRNTFFKSIDPMISVSVFQKRSKLKIGADSQLKNPHAQEILSVWEQEVEGFQTSYYIAFVTKNKIIGNFLESKKQNMTSSRGQAGNLGFFKNTLDDLATSFQEILNEYGITRLNGDEALSFYASYCNMEETITTAKTGILRDHYISSNLEFKKDYMIHDNGQKKYSRFISIKEYDTNEINSKLTHRLLGESIELMFCEQINNLSKEKALKKLDYKINHAEEIALEELINMRELVKTDRQTLLYYSLSILITSDSLDQLNMKSAKVKSILSEYGLIGTIENINMKPLYFSFFPGRDNLNARKRIQTSENISVLNYFEKDLIGFQKNSFGSGAITVFQTLSESPYYFNFHNSSKDNALGHTLLIADSESGKTTLMSFLMTNLLKYNINILALDKLNGMHNFCKYVGGNYADINESFKLNPFSLSYNEENKNFLILLLTQMAGIKSEEFEETQAIDEAIDEVYQHIEGNKTFSDFLDCLERVNELENRFLKYKNGIFDNEECFLSFDNQLTTLNMDAILKDEKLAALVSFYTFYKLKKISQEKGKGFFCFNDELKDSIDNQETAHAILEYILEARKANGIFTAGVQNLDFFDSLNNKASFLDNMAHFIIFPTKSQTSLNKFKTELGLSDSEITFLKTTNPSDHKVLLKNQKTKEAIFLDISLSRLGKYLNVFDSGSNKVAEMKRLIKNSENWREEYLNV
ncbi:hypothetical protein [Sulfurospirillum arcachonense]|uniref:VirB4 family type IV secretion/conjugal transfer ATPase n=1 Tax=Sulfurospirillum arcachonense TaxID=57666 RepID=UPI000468C03A|nr:hypothetical protein [Sulfurospirillum arcachonense]